MTDKLELQPFELEESLNYLYEWHRNWRNPIDGSLHGSYNNPGSLGGDLGRENRET